MLRDNETGLSVALTGEKALDELDVPGYVPLKVGDIRKLGLDVVPKASQPDPELLEIIKIYREDAEGIATTLAANAGVPIATPEHRRRDDESATHAGHVWALLGNGWHAPPSALPATDVSLNRCVDCSYFYQWL